MNNKFSLWKKLCNYKSNKSIIRDNYRSGKKLPIKSFRWGSIKMGLQCCTLFKSSALLIFIWWKIKLFISALWNLISGDPAKGRLKANLNSKTGLVKLDLNFSSFQQDLFSQSKTELYIFIGKANKYLSGYYTNSANIGYESWENTKYDNYCW